MNNNSGEFTPLTSSDEQPPSDKPVTCYSVLTAIGSFLYRRAFLIGLAAIEPFGTTPGPLHPEWSVSYGLIPLIFLLSGLSLKHTDLLYAVSTIKLNFLVQSFNLLFIPAVLYGLSHLLRATTELNTVLLDGIIVLGCLPTTLSTCNILTRSAGATQSIAVFNSAFGNLMGLVYTPGMLLWLLSSQSHVGVWDVLKSLALVLFLPLFVGQCIQLYFKDRLKPIYPYVNPIIQSILVIIIFCTFSDTFKPSESNAPHASASSIVPVMLCMIAAYIFFLVAARLLFALPVFGPFRRADQVAAWFCATQKTVAMGIPLLKVIYKGNPNLGLICLPLLTYHPTQLLVGSTLIPRMIEWMKADPYLALDINSTAASAGGSDGVTGDNGAALTHPIATADTAGDSARVTISNPSSIA